MLTRSALLTIIVTLTLAGCAEAPEHARAKQLMTEFACPGGGTKDTNGQWAAAMANDREKAQRFLKDYERGAHGFQIPIDQVLENLLGQYRIACDGSKEAPLG